VTVGLFIAGVVVFAMVAAGIWLMERADAEPAARAVARAPDPAEEDEARASSVERPGVLVDRDEDRAG
jgi:hypothetical protein